MNRVMKDSGIEWIGNIPQEWEIIKNKYVFKRRNNKVAENYINYQLLSLTKKGIVEKNLNETGGKLPASFSTYQEVQKDDIVLCLFDLDVSAVFSGISKYHGMISSAYDIFKTNQEAIPNYYDYLFQVIGFDRLYLPFSKSLRKTINKENFNSIYTIKPPYNEQIKIVDFLNKSTMNINNIITQTYQSIEELKKYKQSLIAESVTKGIDPNVEMKDSGIDWIGNIPIHWYAGKIKNLFKVKNGGTPSTNTQEYWNPPEINWYTPEDLSKNTDHFIMTSKRMISRKGSNDSSAKIIKKNSLVLSTRAPIGYIKLSSVDFTTNQGCKSLEAKNDEISIKYYYYYLLAKSNILNLYGRGTTFLELPTHVLSEFPILIFNHKEQQQIVQYLDYKISTIDSLIEDKTKVIEELENYKKSLIYEYVTGKKEV